MFFLRKYIGAKSAENLARKEDFTDLTDIVERVRAQFERANLVHRIHPKRNLGRARTFGATRNNISQEFVRLFSIAFGKPTPLQRGEFIKAQEEFADALEAGKPFMKPSGV